MTTKDKYKILLTLSSILFYCQFEFKSINATYNNINFKRFHYDRLMVNNNSFIEYRTAIFA